MGNFIISVLAGILLLVVGSVAFYLFRASRRGTQQSPPGQRSSAVYTPGEVDGTQTVKHIKPPEFGARDKHHG